MVTKQFALVLILLSLATIACCLLTLIGHIQ